MANVYALPPEIKAPEPDYKDMDNHNWGDFFRNQHIKQLVTEIQILKSMLP